MKRWTLFLIVCVLLPFSFTSCSTTKTETETIVEYVPVEIDLTDVVDPVLRLRPDNTQLQIIEDVQTTLDIVSNSIQYQIAWERWQIYAEALEKVLNEVEEVYGPKS